MAALELQVAGKSVLVLAGLYCVMAVLLLFIGVFAFAALAAALVMFLKINWALALLFIAFFNFLVLIPIILLIGKYKRHLSFPKTRKQLQVFEGGEYEKYAKVNEKNSTS